MPGFEEYAQTNTMQERTVFYNTQQNKGLNDKKEFDYDAEQLKEHLEEKFSDEATFAKRTAYYFTNAKVGLAKEKRYRKVHAEAGNTEAANYTRNHPYRFAFKRRYHSMQADLEFTHMRNAMSDYAKDEDKGLSVLRRYKHR